METEEAIAEARENVSRHFSTEPCVVAALLAAIDKHRELAARRNQPTADILNTGV